MEKLQRAEKASELYQGLLKVLELKRFAGVALGEKLYKLRANNEYKNAIGEGIDTWNDFLKQPDVAIDPREATRSMEIYEQFCVVRGYSTDELGTVPTKSLHYLLPVAKSGRLPEGDLRSLVNDAAILTRAAFKEKLHDGLSGGEGTRTFSFVLMRRCNETNNLQKVHDFDSEQIVQIFSKAGIDIQEKIMPEII